MSPSSEAAGAALLVTLAALCTAACAGDTNVIAPLQSLSATPLRSHATVQPIRSVLGAHPTAPTHSASTFGTMLGPYGAEGGVSRSDYALPPGPLAVRWSREIAPTVLPRFLLTTGARIIVQGAALFELRDADGTLIATEALGASDVWLDPAHGLLYHASPLGPLALRRLADGVLEQSVMPFLGKDFQRTLIARRGEHLLVTGIQPLRTTRGGSLGNRSVAERVALDPAPRPSFIPSMGPLDGILHDSAALKSALDGDRLVLAIPGHVYVADTQLQLQHDLTGSFVSVALSVDATGSIYLVVQTATGLALWGVTLTGERFLECALPASTAGLLAPPIVGRDHRVHLVSSARVLSFESPCRAVRDELIPGITGATLAAGGSLLVATRTSLVAFEADGELRMLQRFEADPLMTPPTLTERGEILVASRQRLYCIARRQE